MQTYLSKDRIKAIANYLNSVLPKEKIKVIRELEAKGIEFFYYDVYLWKVHKPDHIKQQFSEFIHKEFKATASREDTNQYQYLYNLGQWEYIYRDLINPFIKKNYKKEWEVVNNIKLFEIDDKLNGIVGIVRDVQLNKHFDLKAIIFADDIEKYLFENYGEKSVKPELLQETERIAKLIDSQYCGRRGVENYQRYQKAVREYMITGDKNLLHNLLNIE